MVKRYFEFSLYSYTTLYCKIHTMLHAEKNLHEQNSGSNEFKVSLCFQNNQKSWSANFVIKTALFEDIIFFSMLMLTLKGISQMKKVTFFINLAQNFILAKLSAKLACANNFLLKMLDITHGSFSNVPMAFCRNGKNLRTEKHKNIFECAFQ